MEVTFPVVLDMTIVASVRRPETTALDEARTVMGWVGKLWVEEGGGVVA